MFFALPTADPKPSFCAPETMLTVKSLPSLKVTGNGPLSTRYWAWGLGWTDLGSVDSPIEQSDRVRSEHRRRHRVDCRHCLCLEYYTMRHHSCGCHYRPYRSQGMLRSPCLRFDRLRGRRVILESLLFKVESVVHKLIVFERERQICVGDRGPL